jgi:hypothetical protein
VAYLENPFHFFEEFFLVVEIRILPVQRVACWSLETAFSHFVSSATTPSRLDDGMASNG